LTSALTNLNSSPRSSWREPVAVAAFLLVLAAAAGWYFYSSGYLLYYGDAQAHLDISRSLIDSRTPGYQQLGTVWLPVLHLICLPFVRNGFLWSSGLAGTIPVATCFVVAGVCLYLCGRETYQDSAAAMAGLLCFALNPNVLYLATITMTEIVFVAGLTVCLFAILRFRKTQNGWYVGLAIGASWWMSLTRYDGWFLIPFMALFLGSSAARNRLRVVIVIGALAALAPSYWIAHNWWETGNALDFYAGPYSAAAIQGDKSYPGFHDWPQAIHYYWEVGRYCCGNGLLAVGILGLLVAIWKGRWLAVLFLSLTPLFYVWSVHSSKTPLHLPTLWPFGYYNSRYGLAVVVWMAFAAGALMTALPQRLRAFGLIVPCITIMPWILRPGPQHWICWKESEHNSLARRNWTAQAAADLSSRYHSGDGLLMESATGDLSGILCKARMPLKESLNIGNGVTWLINTMPNSLVRQTKWAIAQEGDWLSGRIAETGSFQVVKIITVEGAPRVLIYERRHLGDAQ
jgi:hypothetical protein